MRVFSTTPRMIWSTVYWMANTASSAPTTQPAAAPAIRPSHRFPEALATMAATNAPSSSWPSMPMFTTPDREQITPVSAPSMIGMDWLSVPDSRFTTLNEVVWPAPAQQSQGQHEQEHHGADGHPPPQGAQLHHGPQRRQHQRQRAARVAGLGGGQRQVRDRDLGERLGEGEGDVAVVREQAEHEDVHQPEHRERRRRQPAAPGTDRGGLGLHHGGALGDGHASPLPDRPATPAARAARSR